MDWDFVEKGSEPIMVNDNFNISIGAHFSEPRGVCQKHGKINSYAFLFTPQDIGFCAKCCAEAWDAGAQKAIQDTAINAFVFMALNADQDFDKERFVNDMINLLSVVVRPIKTSNKEN